MDYNGIIYRIDNIRHGIDSKRSINDSIVCSISSNLSTYDAIAVPRRRRRQQLSPPSRRYQ
jgi:hypothetical protein